MNTQYNGKNKCTDKQVLKTVWNSLSASDKDKHDVISGCSADPKLSENVCH